MSPQIVIRPAELADAEAIAAFQIAMARETENKTLDQAIVLAAVEAVFQDRGKGHYFVATIAGNVVGCLLITFEWSDWRNSNIWYIQSVYVDAKHRGQGVFRALYEHVIRAAKDRKVKFVRLYVEVANQIAQSSYEKLGMEKLPYYMYQVGIE